MLCPALVGSAVCQLQLQCTDFLRQLPGECLRGKGVWGKTEEALSGEGQLATWRYLIVCCPPSPHPPQRLLSALRFLNLSHNQVQDCEGFLMVSVSRLLGAGPGALIIPL